MTEPTDALLPCPFCGGAASLHNDTDSPCWFVGCSNSACPIEPCHYADTEAEAIATWNHRTPQPTQAQAGAMPRPVTAAEHEVLMAAAQWDALCCVSNNLRTRCTEILEWRKTGVIPGDALRTLASDKYGDEYDALQRAERDTETEALQAVAAAQGDAADAARLDWLGLAGPTNICVVMDRTHDGLVEVSTENVTGYGKTLRAAIDAARAAQENKQ